MDHEVTYAGQLPRVNNVLALHWMIIVTVIGTHYVDG